MMAIFFNSDRVIQTHHLQYFALRGGHCNKPRVPYDQRANPDHSLLSLASFTLSESHRSGLFFVLYPCLGLLQ